MLDEKTRTLIQAVKGARLPKVFEHYLIWKIVTGLCNELSTLGTLLGLALTLDNRPPKRSRGGNPDAIKRLQKELRRWRQLVITGDPEALAFFKAQQLWTGPVVELIASYKAYNLPFDPPPVPPRTTLWGLSRKELQQLTAEWDAAVRAGKQKVSTALRPEVTKPGTLLKAIERVGAIFADGKNSCQNLDPVAIRQFLDNRYVQGHGDQEAAMKQLWEGLCAYLAQKRLEPIKACLADDPTGAFQKALQQIFQSDSELQPLLDDPIRGLR
jgi:hypothetical protein